MKKKVLFLYTELAGYTLACLKRFCSLYPDVRLMLVHYPVNNEAPFELKSIRGITMLKRDSLDRRELLAQVNAFSPDAILVSGWIDRDYVAVAKKFSGKMPTVLLMDNKWEGKFKQHLVSLVAPATFVKDFSHAWVPGEAQKKFALKLGFAQQNIRTGFYSADTDHFMALGEKFASQRKKNIPRRFIFAARYYEFKGLNELLAAFSMLKDQTQTDWELWCAGTGSIVPEEQNGVRHFGFVQPEQMEELMSETSVYILPSRIEPWGVAVHEFACAGFPLLLSDQVGAKESFLRDGVNGFVFEAGNTSAILDVMKKVIALPDEKVKAMGARSRELASKISTTTWANTLNELLNEKAN